MNSNDQSVVSALSFNAAPIQIIDMEGARWVLGVDIGRALGYRKPRNAIYNLFSRNSDEFNESMTTVVQLQDLRVPGAELRPQVGDADPHLRPQPGDADLGLDGDADQAREVRLFSARGAHLLAMFARTPVAAQFRRWVLDVLEGACAKPVAQLSLAQEMSLIRLSVNLMEKVARCDNLARAEELFLRLLRVNRALGMDTLPFTDLAVGGWRQGRLPLNNGPELEAPPH